MIKGTVLPGVLIWVFTLGITLSAQTEISEPQDSILSPPQSMIFIPADWENTGPNSIESDIAYLLTDAARELDCIEVIDWLYTDDVFYNDSIQVDKLIDPSLALYIGEYGHIDQVYLFRIISYLQEGRPPGQANQSFADKLSNFFINLMDDQRTDSTEKYAKNIYTKIELNIDLIDVRRAEILKTFLIRAEYTGGRKLVSMSRTMDILKRKIQDELKRNYFISTKISGLDSGIELFRKKNDKSIRVGDIFEIIEPGLAEYYDDGVMYLPGKNAGYCQVEKVAYSYYKARLLRQWAPIDTGFTALEFKQQIHGFAMDILSPANKTYVAFTARVFYQPILSWDWGISFRVQKAEDSIREQNWGIGFGALGTYRILNISRFALKARLDADVDFFFKDDDSGNSVTLILGSLAPGLSADFVFAKNTDIYLHGGYRFWGKSDKWQANNSENDSKSDAYWDGPSPEMDLSGSFVNVGIRFLFK